MEFFLNIKNTKMF